jgi:hypothetical protein
MYSVCSTVRIDLIELLIPRSVVHVLVRVTGPGFLGWIDADCGCRCSDSWYASSLAVFSCAKKNPEAASADQQLQATHQHRAGTGSCLVLDNGPVDAHQATSTPNSLASCSLRCGASLQPRSRLVRSLHCCCCFVLLGSHEGFDVVGAEQTTDGTARN